MKRIISKIDYDMKKLGDLDPNLALELWCKIKNRSFIINEAVKIVEDKDKRKGFFAPAICHMILSNPCDVDHELYEKLVISVIKDTDLNRITVFDNMSFLQLILLNGTKNLDDYFIRYINEEIKNKAYLKPFMLRYVQYGDVLCSEEKIISFKDGTFDISLSSEEADMYSNREYISYCDGEGEEEVNSLMELVSDEENNIDVSIKYSIKDLKSRSLIRKMHIINE